MFHPHFLRLYFGVTHSTADAMTVVAAFKIEEALQRTCKEEREREQQSRVESEAEERRGNPLRI
ncbi:MAG: hypothetical protein ACLQBD_28285 [Syntrophobacteraceae bacterium]